MLKDRKELIEHDITLLKEQAAAMYFDLAVQGHGLHNHERQAEYQQKRDRIMQLQFDLDMINHMLEKGSP